jgi:hypothetical protein
MSNPHKETVQQLINIARHLHQTGRSSGSTGEIIAAAFILNEVKYLPDHYSDMVEAWERLGHYQKYVKVIKSDFMHLVKPE